MGFPTNIIREHFLEAIKEIVEYMGDLIRFEVTDYNNTVEQWNKHFQ